MRRERERKIELENKRNNILRKGGENQLVVVILHQIQMIITNKIINKYTRIFLSFIIFACLEHYIYMFLFDFLTGVFQISYIFISRKYSSHTLFEFLIKEQNVKNVFILFSFIQILLKIKFENKKLVEKIYKNRFSKNVREKKSKTQSTPLDQQQYLHTYDNTNNNNNNNSYNTLSLVESKGKQKRALLLFTFQEYTHTHTHFHLL